MLRSRLGCLVLLVAADKSFGGRVYPYVTPSARVRRTWRGTKRWATTHPQPRRKRSTALNFLCRTGRF